MSTRRHKADLQHGVGAFAAVLQVVNDLGLRGGGQREPGHGDAELAQCAQ